MNKKDVWVYACKYCIDLFNTISNTELSYDSLRSTLDKEFNNIENGMDNTFTHINSIHNTMEKTEDTEP